MLIVSFFFFSSRRRHTRCSRDWSSDVCSSDLRASRSGGIAISAITLWELAWLASHGRVEITGTVEAYVEEVSSRVAIRPLTEIGRASCEGKSVDLGGRRIIKKKKKRQRMACAH